MVVTSPLLISLRSATGPSESLWPISVELRFVRVELLLKLFFHVVGLLSYAIAPSHALPTTGGFPCNQFQLSFVGFTVPAFAVTIDPLARRGRIGG